MKHLDNNGVETIEYVLIIGLIAIIAIVGVRNLSNSIGGQTSSISSKVTDALTDNSDRKQIL